jgi:hypothetical protein
VAEYKMIEIDYVNLILTIVATIIAIISTFLLAYNIGYKKAKKELQNDIQKKRYEEIYSPLIALFTTRHITTSQGIAAGYFRIRLRFFWRHLKRGNIKESVTSLWNKRKTKIGAEVEYGGSFPFKEIKKIVFGKEKYMDNKLLNLIISVDRSLYEGYYEGKDYNLLTDEEFELFIHISEEHYKLNKKFVS